ncbi:MULTISPECIES: hypothetical protein [Cupriavidus]
MAALLRGKVLCNQWLAETENHGSATQKINYTLSTLPQSGDVEIQKIPSTMTAPETVPEPAPAALPERFTPEQFKALVRWKGWSYRELAARWGISAVWVSNVARNRARPAHYDDALRGLPHKRTMTRDARLLAQRLAALVAGAAQAAALRARARTRTGGYRYHGYLGVGDIVTAAEELGLVAEEGERGIVFQVIDTGKGERYGIVFERGLWDWFAPEHLDLAIAATGLTDARLAAEPPVDEVALAKRIAARALTFWPAAPA